MEISSDSEEEDWSPDSGPRLFPHSLLLLYSHILSSSLSSSLSPSSLSALNPQPHSLSPFPFLINPKP